MAKRSRRSDYRSASRSRTHASLRYFASADLLGARQLRLGPLALLGVGPLLQRALEGVDGRLTSHVDDVGDARDALGELRGGHVGIGKHSEVSLGPGVVGDGAVLDHGVLPAVLGVPGELPARAAVAHHVVCGMEAAEVAGGLVDRRSLALDEVGVDAQPGEAVEDRRAELVVALDEFPRELVGRRGDGVGDVALVVVVDAAAAGLSAGDVHPSRLAVLPVDGVDGLPVAHRETGGRPAVDADCARPAGSGPFRRPLRPAPC